MIDWTEIRHFTPGEFKHPDKMAFRTIHLLDAMRHAEDLRRRGAGKSGIIILIFEDWAERPDNPNSEHPQGRAVDGAILDAGTGQPLDVFEQYLISSRYLWTGLGFYPYWDRPGCHWDTRPKTIFQPFARWWRDANGVYRSVEDYIKRAQRVNGLNELTG